MYMRIVRKRLALREGGRTGGRWRSVVERWKEHDVLHGMRSRSVYSGFKGRGHYQVSEVWFASVQE
jgi:hypothetical protein